MDHTLPANRGLKIFIIFLLPLLISNGSMWINDQLNSRERSPLVMKNAFSVAGISLANMTKEDAMNVVSQAVESIDQQDIQIIIDDRQWSIAVADLEVEYDVSATIEEAFSLTSISSRQHIPLVMQYNKQFLRDTLSEIAKEVDIYPVSAQLVQNGNRLAKLSEQMGRILHVDNTMLTIQTALANGLPDNTFIISLQNVQPKVTMLDLRDVDKHFASFTTHVDEQDTNRSINIERASHLLDGFVIRPEEVFSFHQLAAPYTLENGYIQAPVITDDSLVTLGVGGGICQVSTTVFVAAVKAGLDVVEHHHHSRPVHYIEQGYDATVVDAKEDLKLKNNKNKNLYITVSYDNHQIQVDVYGNQENYIDYSLETRNHQVINADTIYQLDLQLADKAEAFVKQGEPGYKVDLYRVWLENGDQREQKIAQFDYPPISNVINIGSKHDRASQAVGKDGAKDENRKTQSKEQLG